MVAAWLATGFRALDIPFKVVNRRAVKAGDIAVFYGYDPDLFRLYEGRVIFLDRGYWHRDRRQGYYRIAVNCHGPSCVDLGLPDDRFRALGLPIADWKAPDDDAPILVAAMGPKACKVRGMDRDAWEISFIEAARCVTRRPILLRAKREHERQTHAPVPGIGMDRIADPMASIARSALVACRHSNMAIDALRLGVPVHVSHGPCVPFSTPLGELNAPRRWQGRDQLLADLAWLQWSGAEIRSGAAWAFVQDHLIPRLEADPDFMSKGRVL